MRWDLRKYGAPFDQESYVTVDGTDFRIFEPEHFSPDWYSHKYKGPGLRYEIAISIATGYIVSVHGPFPCGLWTDRKIFNAALRGELDEGELAIGDGGYKGVGCRTPTGYNTLLDRMCSVARARHETVNHRFKEWSCLNNVYRHDRREHYQFFAPIALLVQLGIEQEGMVFQFAYHEF